MKILNLVSRSSMYKSYICFIILCCAQLSYAQDTGGAVITGTIKKALLKEISIEVNTRHISNKVERYHSDIVNDTFTFRIPINEPQIVYIKYLRSRAEIYLEPNDSVHIDTDAYQFQYAFEFSGKGANNNEMLYAFRREFYEETNPFKIMQYKKGAHWYFADRELDSKMRTLKEQDFTKYVSEERAAKNNMLETYETATGKRVSDYFRFFLWSEINYKWSFDMLTYGYAFGNKHRINKDTFFFFMYEVPLQNNRALGNEKYRNYLLGTINFKAHQIYDSGNPYVNQYHLADSLLRGRARAFAQAAILHDAIKNKQLTFVLDIYQDYMINNRYAEFSQGLTDAYQQANKYAEGNQAPSVQFTDINGISQSLATHQGNVVFVNYWASFCPPCIDKMEELKPVQASLEDSGVIFIHISFDRDTTKWLNKIQEHNFTGVHVIAPKGVQSRLAKAFEVKALPEYFIIDKYGKMAAKPRRYNVNAISTQLSNLSDKTIGKRLFGGGNRQD